MSPILVTFVTACTALVAAIVGPYITFKIGKAQINASVLSTSRQRWMEGFRDQVAAFCSQAITAIYVRGKSIEEGPLIIAPQDAELLRRIENLVLTFTKLRLMTNPTERDHQTLVELLGLAMTALRTAPLTADLEKQMEAMIDDIIVQTQIILKREWRRVKMGD